MKWDISTNNYKQNIFQHPKSLSKTKTNCQKMKFPNQTGDPRKTFSYTFAKVEKNIGEEQE